MPAPQKLVKPSISRMPPPPPRILPPPPPPPKFNSPKPASSIVLDKSKPESVPDTLIKLLEYGEEDDDPDEITDEPYRSNSNGLGARKPFWAEVHKECIATDLDGMKLLMEVKMN
ncbi:RS2-interacting KH protein [Actinidia rufa]|uniref:RS2-interacting KH protein n=1 Tax=Actinidia rufa TaxID=165716 RepID=A0A7J0H812_9ERIC|nr:RS2-interacting KH protein [Actinidia rufa]